jgi:hypothetical protein
MLLVSLILAVVGLVALVAAAITNNEMVAWVCIGASSLGVILLIVDAIRERTVQPPPGDLTASDDATAPPFVADADATDVIESDVVDSTDVGETDVGETDVIESDVIESDVADSTDVGETDVIESDVAYSTDVGETDVIESDVAYSTDVVETEDHPEELVHDEPEYDMPDDDEPEYAEPAEEAAMHLLDEQPESDR